MSFQIGAQTIAASAAVAHGARTRRSTHEGSRVIENARTKASQIAEGRNDGGINC